MEARSHRHGGFDFADLYHGAHRSQRAQQDLLKVETFLRPFVSVPFEGDAAREYGRLRPDLERRGLAIGPPDLQIAVIALVHGLTLVTHHTREFRDVGGLNLEDWQASP